MRLSRETPPPMANSRDDASHRHYSPPPEVCVVLFPVIAPQPSLEARLQHYARWGEGGQQLSLADFEAFWRNSTRPEPTTVAGMRLAAGGGGLLGEAQTDDEARRLFESGGHQLRWTRVQ